MIKPETALEALNAKCYLDLLKKALTAELYDESAWSVIPGPRKLDIRHPSLFLRDAMRNAFLWLGRKQGLTYVQCRPFLAEKREIGKDWPMFGYSMIGLKRMDNIWECIDSVFRDDVKGDFIETGVWRGGSCIFMRAILGTYGDTGRCVWAADSFEGLPKPDAPASGLLDQQDLSENQYLKVSLEEVQRNFRRFGLLDGQVRFIKGWFKDTLGCAPIDRLAILRLDGDLYESTMDAIRPLYPKVSPGGFVIVDDYYTWEGCRKAIDEYRQEFNITAKIHEIDGSAIFWRIP